MNPEWPVISLREILNYRKEFITIDELETYKLCRVQTRSQGVILREKKQGFDIKTKRQQICRANDLIFAEMDARFGGYGIIPEKLDGAIVSSHYFLYEVDYSKIKKKYLEYCLLQQWFLDQVEAKGSTNYASIRPQNVLDYLIPFPSLEEQCQIVAKSEVVSEKSQKINHLRSEQERLFSQLSGSLFKDFFNTYPPIEIGEILIPKREKVAIDPVKEYKQVKVRLDYKGVVLRKRIKGEEVHSIQYLARKGNFIISKIDARNAAMGIIPPDLDGAIVTNDFPLFGFQKMVIDKYFNYFSHTGLFENACKRASEGSTNRRRLKLDKFKKIEMPLPTIEEQQRIVSILERITNIVRIQNKTVGQLDELFSALLDKAFKGELV